MAKIVKDGQLFDRRVYASKDQARVELASEPFQAGTHRRQVR